MKILYDHQLFSLEIMGGMSKYYLQLIQWFEKQWHQVVVPVFWTHNQYLQRYFDSKSIPYVRWLSRWSFKGRQNLVYRFNKLYRRWNKDRLLEWVDLVHLTLFDPYMIDTLRKAGIPFVFTVYDLNHKTQQLKRTWWDMRMCDYADRGIDELARHAGWIICVSWQTKRDLLHYYPSISLSLIHLIYHSIDLSLYKRYLPEGQEAAHKTPYVLFIGKRKASYKNFKPFVQAIAPLLNDQLHLVCLWHEPFDSQEKALFTELGITTTVYHYLGDESVKFNLLSHARCFVYPSIAEWFGIPILEAWVAWAPVVCSSITVFMEIGQGAALYFDPRSLDNMRELIWSVVINKDIQDNLKVLWAQRVEQFDLSVESKKTMELYQKISIVS